EVTQPETPRKLPQSRLFNGSLGIATVLLLRLVVGGTFAFAGFAKAIDPWGSVYKFGEYLAAFGFAHLDWSLLFLAVSAGTIEFALGIFMIFGIYRRFTPITMLAAMLVMLPVTGYIAITDAVPDCGCFGDALVLGNRATFAKNLILTPLIIYLCTFNRYVKNVYGFAVQWIVALLSIAYAMILAFIGYYIQPLIDFRPYPIGAPIVSLYEPADEPQYEFTYEKNGTKRSFTIDSLPDDTWTYVDRREIHGTVRNNAPDAIAISTLDGSPADSVLLRSGEQILLLFPDLNKVGIAYTYLINEMHDYARSHGIDVVGLTSADAKAVAEWNDLSMASYSLFSIDDSTLKMIARGNPAVVYLRDGHVVWKRTLQSISMEYITNERDMDGIGSDFNQSRWLKALSLIYALLMVLVLIVNRTHLLVIFSLKRFIRHPKQPKSQKN
ncbi:MAG: BT_3928 family protein, partial [Muribaculaceae bacterium]